MTKEDLEKISNEHTKKAKLFLYDKSEIYSFGKIIKSYGFFPKILPNPVLTDHSGPNFADFLYWHEQVDYKLDFLTHTLEKAKHYSETQMGNGYAMYPPYLWYYKKNKANYDNLKKKYITYIPVHNLPELTIQNYIDHAHKVSKKRKVDIPNSKYDFEKLILEIKSLKTKNVRVCLHSHDIKKGFHKYFLKHNIEVVSAGNSLDDNFVDRFFNILFTSKYMVGNQIGTAFLYSTLFKVEFKLTKTIPVINFEGKYDRIIYKKIKEKNLTNLSPQIIEIVDLFFEKRKFLSRFQTACILYKNFFRFQNLKKIIFIIINKIFR